jgi:hypothetical protein
LGRESENYLIRTVWTAATESRSTIAIVKSDAEAARDSWVSHRVAMSDKRRPRFNQGMRDERMSEKYGPGWDLRAQGLPPSDPTEIPIRSTPRAFVPDATRRKGKSPVELPFMTVPGVWLCFVHSQRAVRKGSAPKGKTRVYAVRNTRTSNKIPGHRSECVPFLSPANYSSPRQSALSGPILGQPF